MEKRDEAVIFSAGFCFSMNTIDLGGGVSECTFQIREPEGSVIYRYRAFVRHEDGRVEIGQRAANVFVPLYPIDKKIHPGGPWPVEIYSSKAEK